ncbi:MAG: hypothetical protein UY15_C0029G0008 [Parcubacteria group bacterium GW2011_GWA2_47_9]|nr:MAG: hypothetical protein UY15_C0029G0008 [Parcubacteria group bacterium GW2011_GWA2_47_9]
MESMWYGKPKRKLRIMSLENITRFFLLAGIVTHPIWSWSFKATFIPKPSDFFFILAIAGALAYFYTKGRKDLFLVPRLLYAALFLFGASIALGTAMGYIRYGIPVGGWHLVLYYLVRVGGGFILLLFSYISLKDSFWFRKAIYGAFAASFLVFIPVLLMPGFWEKFSNEQGRFFGLAGNAGMFAVLVFPSFVFAFFLLLRALFSPYAKKSIFQLAPLAIGLEMLILWSGTRSYFGAIILTVVVGSAILGRFYGFGLKKILVSTALMGFAAFLVLFLFPASVHRAGLLNQYPAYFQVAREQAEQIRHFAELQVRENNYEIPRAQLLTTQEPRLSGFQYYFSLLKADPLILLFGVGINYEHKFSMPLLVGKGDMLAAGSVVFDPFLYGGIGAALGLLLLVWMILKRIMLLFKVREEPVQDPIYVLAPAITLLGWWAAAIFMVTPIALIPNWILVAMTLAITPKS